MSVLIKNRKRAVKFQNGKPFVNVAGGPRWINRLLAAGDTNTKMRKSSGLGFLTAGLSLSPSTESGIGNTCPFASNGCADSCLNEQGLASIYEMIQASRVAKTVFYYRERKLFFEMLQNDIGRFRRKAERDNLQLAMRLNVFSDIQWERSTIIDSNRDIQFYDYTKNPKRAGLLRPNYWVTFSRSESNDADCLNVLREGNNVAVVFADVSKSFCGNKSGEQVLPKTWNGFKVIDGDTTDLRFDDLRGGYVIGLRLKTSSKAKRAAALESGFPVLSIGGQLC
jgi:hypothetical protein